MENVRRMNAHTVEMAREILPKLEPALEDYLNSKASDSPLLRQILWDNKAEIVGILEDVAGLYDPAI
jgi:hypothetical protein